MKSLVLPAAIPHRNFVAARHATTELVRNSPGDQVLALIGPTRAGKSLIFQHVVEELKGAIRQPDATAMSVVHLTLATSQDGRISPKHLTLMMLKKLRHPIYMHIGELDELNHYRPSRGRDESTMRTAVGCALEGRSTLYIALDEAHHLTHTRDPNVRANVLSSIKCMSAIDRTLFLVGGYELAYRGLFDSAHFAGRLMCVEFPPYIDTDADFEEWLRILKSLSDHVKLASRSLLIDAAETLLHVTNGSFGLLEKIVWRASVLSSSAGNTVDRTALLEAFPSKKEHDAIRRDIAAGQSALADLPTAQLNANAPPTPQQTPRAKRRPFERNPNREVAAIVLDQAGE
jgi:hypothetical protein